MNRISRWIAEVMLVALCVSSVIVIANGDNPTIIMVGCIHLTVFSASLIRMYFESNKQDETVQIIELKKQLIESQMTNKVMEEQLYEYASKRFVNHIT